jgi:hypothetical protein
MAKKETCSNILKPGKNKLLVPSSNVIWNGGKLCLTDSILDGNNLNDIVALIAQRICDIECPDFPPIPTIEEEIITNAQGVLLNDDANFVGNTYFEFAAFGYESMIYTNNSGDTKTYIVEATSNAGRNSITPNEYGSSELDMAIYKRDLAPSDTLISEVSNKSLIFFDSTLDPGDVNPTLYFIQSTLHDKAEVELLDGESVLLKFKTKNAGSGYINKSILHIREKHI